MNRDLRERIDKILDAVPDDKIRELIDLALTSEKDSWATCTNCRHRIPIKIPDLGARAKMLEVLINQGKGKPKETVKKEVVLRRVDEMSVNELDDEERRILADYPELA